MSEAIVKSMKRRYAFISTSKIHPSCLRDYCLGVMVGDFDVTVGKWPNYECLVKV